MSSRVVKLMENPPSVTPFRFESYGVRVEITSNLQEVVDKAAAVATTSLLHRLEPIEKGPFDHRFHLPVTAKGTFKMFQNGEHVSHGRSEWKFFRFFDSMIRVAVGEYARGFVFMHAGVVAWKGRAIVIPADSFQGKSTLVAELVRQGAEYYSDEFAVVDGNGLVHPFPRRISMRTDGRNMKIYDLSPEDLGGRAGTNLIPVGALIFTQYTPESRWRPRRTSPGEAVLKLIPHVLPIRREPQFSLAVLNRVAKDAIIFSSRRGEADVFSEKLLKLVDKHVV